MKYDYHIIILGAGSAGLTIATGAAKFGAKVALVEADKMGGDCLNTGCVPSKAFLKICHTAHEITNSNELGLTSSLSPINIKKVINRVKESILLIEPHDSKEKFEKLGVDVFLSSGQFIDKHSIQVNDNIITAKNIVIATGSEPRIPDIPGLDNIDYLTSNTLFSINELPDKLIILGAGPLGLEIGQGFKHLGSEVTLVDKIPHLFPKEDKEVYELMENRLSSEGINLKLNSKIIRVSKEQDKYKIEIEQNGVSEIISSDKLLVAMGRTPNSNNLMLNNAGINSTDYGYIFTNSKLQTNVKNIFACGDVSGHYNFTSSAGHEAGVVLKNSIFKLSAKIDFSSLPWVTYTKPEVAHVGFTQLAAEKSGIYGSSVIVDIADNDRAIVNNNKHGFLKLNLNRNGRIIGAALVAENAGEMISLATLAIKKKLKPSAFIGMIFPYPTESEVFLYASLKKAMSGIKTWHKKLIKFIFLR